MRWLWLTIALFGCDRSVDWTISAPAGTQAGFVQVSEAACPQLDDDVLEVVHEEWIPAVNGAMGPRAPSLGDDGEPHCFRAWALDRDCRVIGFGQTSAVPSDTSTIRIDVSSSSRTVDCRLGNCPSCQSGDGGPGDAERPDGSVDARFDGPVVTELRRVGPTVGSFTPRQVSYEWQGGEGPYCLELLTAGDDGPFRTAWVSPEMIVDQNFTAETDLPGNGPLRRTAVAWNVYDCAGLEFGACEEALVSGGCALADGGPWPFHPGTQRTDLNGDGYADVVIGRPFDNRVDIWCGGPAGLRSAGFIEPESCSPIGFGTTIAVGQLTGNGRASIVVGYVRCQGQQPGYFVYSNFDDSCRPLLTATREPVETRGPGAPVLSAEADIDVDGIHDLLIADGSRNLQALLGSGEALSLGTIPDGVAALRADGDLDVLTANDGQNSIAVVTSRGDATLVNDSSRFTVPRFATLGRRVVGQADGIIGVRNGQTNAVVMSSTGVTLEIPLGFSPERVMFETGDLDGDEQTDFVLGSIDMVGADGGIAVVLGASVGAPMGVLSGPGGAPLSGRFAAGGDANGDGRSDIVVSAEGKMYVVSFQEESPTYYEIGDVPPQFATQIALDF